jgi:uncharacterized protein
MQFLRKSSKPKIVRTKLYGDQEFTRFELEVLHTPMMQRLYGLKQLGFADRVYPDAIHTRFNHVLGVVDVVSPRLEADWATRDYLRLIRVRRVFLYFVSTIRTGVQNM